MSVEIREASSRSFRRSMRIVKRMTGSMGFDGNIGKVNWKAVRFVSDIGYRMMPRAKGTVCHRETIGGVQVLHIRPAVCSSDAVILYLHGGGFVSGSAAGAAGYGSMLAARCGCSVIAPDYALAPEHPYPAALLDCLRVYRGILAKRVSVALIGESAGGNLCLALTGKLRSDGIRLPLCIVVHSPFADFTGCIGRNRYKAEDFTVHPSCLPPLRRIYVPEGMDPADPLISPAFADFRGFPPAYITCDARETLFADACTVYRGLRAGHVPARLVIMKHAYHAFAALGTGSPETDRILTDTAVLIRQCLHEQ